jgi:peptidoglycan-associated lipoprotein
MNIKLVGALAIAALLAACSSPPPPAPTAASTGGGATAATAGPAPGSQEDLVAKAGDRVFYAFNSSSLSSDAQSTLDRQAEFFTTYPQDNLEIAGNCDERGTEEYNLGQRRANAARDYLVAKGIASSRISTISYGKDHPVALGSDEEAWAQNRNATTTVR